MTEEQWVNGQKIAANIDVKDAMHYIDDSFHNYITSNETKMIRDILLRAAKRRTDAKKKQWYSSMK